MRRETSKIYTCAIVFAKIELGKVFLGDKRIAREFTEKYESKNYSRGTVL
jgi:hypothetical protein